MSENGVTTEYSEHVGTSEPIKTKDIESTENQSSRDSAQLETQESPEKIESSQSGGKSKKNKKNKKETSAKQEKEIEVKENKPEIDENEIEGEILRPDMLPENELGEDDEDEKYNYDEYGNMDRLDIPKHEKELGRLAFSQGKYEDASKHYSKAILGTNYLFKDGLVPTEEKAAEFLRDIQIPCYLNNALCYIKLKMWKLCIECANAALTLDEDNVKALYRKAVGTYNTGDLEETAKLLKRALEIEPNNGEIRALAQELREKKKQQYEKEKKMGQKMVEELAKIREEEQKKQETPTKAGEHNALAALEKVIELKNRVVDPIYAVKNKVVEPIYAGKKEVERKIKTWKDHVKLLILLPLDIMSTICCRRRLPSQFYKVEENKKNT